MFSKKVLILIVIILAAIFVVGGFFGLKDYLMPKVEIEKKVEESAVFSEPKSAVEEEIEATKKQLEELYKLTPEEIKKREEERQALSAQDITTDVLVSGVEILFEGNKKIIKNTAQRYRIEIPSELIVARTVKSDLVEIYDPKTMCKEDPSCDPIIRIRTGEDNPQKLDLEKWFKAEEEKSGSDIYSPREKIIISGNTAYKIIESIPGVFDGYYYYWSRGSKIYYLRISAFDEEKYREFVETFTFE